MRLLNMQFIMVITYYESFVCTSFFSIGTTVHTCYMSLVVIPNVLINRVTKSVDLQLDAWLIMYQCHPFLPYFSTDFMLVGIPKLSAFFYLYQCTRDHCNIFVVVVFVYIQRKAFIRFILYRDRHVNMILGRTFQSTIFLCKLFASSKQRFEKPVF